ncbi:hypothetical protein V5799_032160 [Amblyomma americanum]|uniref:HTH CENPB-type domain-containing protein n=1 Tax=Amblyomma americanum TaxID=6943 RepID=A0AAQ4DRZ1_AMBAM
MADPPADYRMTLPVKRKRMAIDLENKCSIVKDYKDGKKAVSQLTLSTIIRSAEKFGKEKCSLESGRKRVRQGAYKEVEEALYEWYVGARAQNLPVTGPILVTKAKQFALLINNVDFQPGGGWVQRFKERPLRRMLASFTWSDLLSSLAQERVPSPGCRLGCRAPPGQGGVTLATTRPVDDRYDWARLTPLLGALELPVLMRIVSSLILERRIILVSDDSTLSCAMLKVCITPQVRALSLPALKVIFRFYLCGKLPPWTDLSTCSLRRLLRH